VRDLDAWPEPVHSVDEQDNIGRFRGGGCPTSSHGNAYVGGRKGRSVIHPIADHHHRAALTLRENQKNLLIRGKSGTYTVEPEADGYPLRNLLPISGSQQNAATSCRRNPSSMSLRPIAQWIGHDNVARKLPVDPDRHQH
jgi:hypothetical protein